MVFRTLHELGHDEKSVQLIDTAETLDTMHNLHLRGTDVVLVPQPSNDPNDPLRWSTWKKHMAFLNVCIFAAMTTGFISGFSPALYLLSLEFKKDLTATSHLITWPLLVSGLGNFFWVPTGEYFGKRPVFVIASLILFCSVIGSAVSTSFGGLLASRVLAAFGGSSTEALGAAMVNDIFFLHERGSKMGLYIIFLYGGNSLMSLISGFVVQGAGWRWFAWLCAIISGLNFLGIFLFVHETRFKRRADQMGSVPEASDSDKNVPLSIEEKPTLSVSNSEVSGKKNTFLDNLKIWSGTSNAAYSSHLLRPFLLIAYPAVVWGIIAFSLCLAWQIAANTLSSFVFQPPPYNFSPGTNGLINIPAIIGNLGGSVIGGYLTDVYAKHSARRNNGKFSPESRLVMLIFPALLVPAGLLMFGFGAERKLHWAVLYVGYAFLNTVTAVASIAMTYVIESYFEVAAEALLMVNAMKNVVGWGFTYGFVPWTVSAGYETVFGTMAAIFFGWMAMALPLFLFGSVMRNYTTTKFRVIFW